MIHNDSELFETLTLEATAAGLNRRMVQNKRPEYRKAFSNFNITKVAKFSASKVNQLLKPSSKIIKNRAKIEAVVNNAKMILKIKKEFGSFDKYIWGFVKGKKLTYAKKKNRTVSESLSKDLKAWGFKFTGPSACYVFIHSVGMVDIPAGTIRKKATELP